MIKQNEKYLEMGIQSNLTASQFDAGSGSRQPVNTPQRLMIMSSQAAMIQTAGSITESTRKPDFYLFTAGLMENMKELAMELEVEFPVYSLLAGKLEDADALITRSILDTAAAAVDEIRQVQPKGPYYLFGWSFGGYLAYEIARLLKKQGERVAFLGVVDTRAASLPRFKEQLNWYQKSHFVRSNAARVVDYAWDNLTSGPLERIWGFLRGGYGRWRSGIAAADERPTDPQFEFQAVKNYKPEVYTGTLHLFWGQRGKDRTCFRPVLGWEYLVKGGVEIYTSPGDHLTVIQPPNSRDLGTRMRGVIRRIRDSRPVVRPVQQEGKDNRTRT